MIVSFLAGVFLTLAGLLTNYLYYQKNHTLLLARRMFGGEITVETGFGLKMIHIYGMTPLDSGSVSLRFDPLSFIISILIFTILIFIIISLLNRKK